MTITGVSNSGLLRFRQQEAGSGTPGRAVLQVYYMLPSDASISPVAAPHTPYTLFPMK